MKLKLVVRVKKLSSSHIGVVAYSEGQRCWKNSVDCSDQGSIRCSLGLQQWGVAMQLWSGSIWQHIFSLWTEGIQATLLLWSRCKATESILAVILWEEEQYNISRIFMFGFLFTYIYIEWKWNIIIRMPYWLDIKNYTDLTPIIVKHIVEWIFFEEYFVWNVFIHIKLK